MDFARIDDETLLAMRSVAEAGPSFEAFYERHERLVVAFHMRRTGDPDTAADLTAETFAQALASRHRFRATGPDSAVRWLYGIAGNLLLRRHRTQSTELLKVRKLQLDRPDLNDAELAAISNAGDDGAVLAALAELPESQQAVIRAVVLDGSSDDDIAATAGLNPATVRKRVSRGLATLRRNLEDSR